MKRKEIVFIIDKNGGIASTVKGIKGTGCSNIVKSLKNDLGEVISEKRTAEYYQINEAASVIQTKIEDK